MDETFSPGPEEFKDPYDLGGIFSKISQHKVINKNPLENNLSNIMAKVVYSLVNMETTRYSAIASVSEDKISFKININDVSTYQVLARRKQTGYVTIGVTVKTDLENPYGITLVPIIPYIVDVDVPDIMRSTLKQFIQNSNYYLHDGLGKPPVWFIRVKIDELNEKDLGSDIRE